MQTLNTTDGSLTCWIQKFFVIPHVCEQTQHVDLMVLGMGTRIHLWPEWHHNYNDKDQQSKVKDQHLTCIIQMFYFSPQSTLAEIKHLYDASVGVSKVRCEWKSECLAPETVPAAQNIGALWIPEFCGMSQFLTVENPTLLILPVTHQYSSPIYANPPPLSHL